jgi:hypothetical protein
MRQYHTQLVLYSCIGRLCMNESKTGWKESYLCEASTSMKRQHKYPQMNKLINKKYEQSMLL